MALVPTIKTLDDARRAIQKLAGNKLGPNASPTFYGLTLTTPLLVPSGGTGLATLTNHGLLLGSGTGAITPLAEATDGQIPIGDTDGDPILATITGTANQVNIANAAGSITLSLPQDIHTGASPTFTGLTLSNLTQGSVIFAGASGVISQDNSNLFWDSTNNRLGIGINSGFFPAAGLTVSGEMDLIHTSSEADDHAFEIDVDAAGYGDVKAVDIDYITGDISMGEDEAVILINVDEIEAAGGDVFGLEILATEGAAGSTTTVYGLKAGVLVGPIHQDSGTFENPTVATNDTPSTNVPYMIDGLIGNVTPIFSSVPNDDDYILIGDIAAFEEIEFIITTGSSGAGIKPKFEYSRAGSNLFTEFFPVDGTNGFRNTGVVAWDADDLTNHGLNTDTTPDTYCIKITRQRTNLTTTPILGFAKVAATTEYIWDKSGNVNIKTLTVSTIAAESSDVDKFLVDSSGVIKYRTGAQVLADIGGQVTHANLTSLAALSYVAASFVKMTGANTFALRTIGETADDLEATIDHDNLANGGAHDYAYISGNDAGTGVTAAELEELSDGSETTLHSHAGGAVDPTSAVSVYLSANQTINDVTLTTVAFNTEDYDLDNEFNTTTHIFTCKTAGYYAITFFVTFDIDEVGSSISAYITLNEVAMAQMAAMTYSEGWQTNFAHKDVYLDVDDEIEFLVYQNSSGNKPILGGVAKTFATIHKISG